MYNYLDKYANKTGQTLLYEMVNVICFERHIITITLTHALFYT